MPAIAQPLLLPSLNSAIDFSPIVVAPDTPLLDAIALMNQCQPQASNVLVGENLQVVGWLRDRDIVRLISSSVDLKTTSISEVMATSVITLKHSDIQDMTSVLSILRQHPLPLLLVVNEQGQLVGCITCESICHAIESTDLRLTQAALKQANEELEIRVAQRTKALEEMNRQLADEIADRQLAEEQLQQSQEMLQLIMDNIPQSVFWKDTTSVYLGCNRNFARIVGFDSPEDIVGKTDYDLVCDQKEANLYRVFDIRVMKTDTPEHHMIKSYLRKDGTTSWLETNKVPLHDAEGCVIGILGSVEDITERKQAMEALEESKERFRFLVESIPQQVWFAKADGSIEYVNQRLLDYCACTNEQILRWGWLQWIHPEDVQQYLDCWNKSLATSEIYEVEFRLLKTSHQTYHWHLARALPLRNKEGQILSWFGTNTDIDDRKRAEENLRLRDRAIAASNNGIVISDVTMPDSPIIYANPAFEQITGYTAAEVIGKNCRFLRGTDINQPELQKLRAAIEAAKSCTVVLRNYRKDGSQFWNELSISPVYDSHSKFTHYIGIQTDITQRKLAETALLVWQERLQYLLSSSPGVIYTCKASGDYSATFISENIVAMMGYEVREIVEDASFWLSHVHPEDIAQLLADRPNLFEQGQYSVEYRFLHKDGSYRWVYDQAKLVQDEAGNPVEIIGYWADITQRKKLEQELRGALEKEKELNDLKSRFISMTSHEFRTPLSTILSSAELLEHYHHKWTEEKQLTHLHRIQTAVKHMTEMLNDVLVIAKAEAGRLDFRPAPLDLVEYCLCVMEELQLNANNQRAMAFSSQHQSMPSLMDEKLLGHILSNLLSNAIKYSPTDSIVKFTLTCQQGRAIFEIQDQGIGIPPEDLPLLFESFYRATNVGNIQGTGLGLAIVKKCVDSHEGEIAVTSQVGVGTTFTVTLPLISV